MALKKLLTKTLEHEQITRNEYAVEMIPTMKLHFLQKCYCECLLLKMFHSKTVNASKMLKEAQKTKQKNSKIKVEILEKRLKVGSRHKLKFAPR